MIHGLIIFMDNTAVPGACLHNPPRVLPQHGKENRKSIRSQTIPWIQSQCFVRASAIGKGPSLARQEHGFIFGAIRNTLAFKRLLGAGPRKIYCHQVSSLYPLFAYGYSLYLTSSPITPISLFTVSFFSVFHGTP